MQVFVIGGGAAGVFSAIIAAKNGASVTVIEKNEKIGKKLYITGKGRCNLTNCASLDVYLDKVISNPKFLMSALRAFDCNATMKFFTENGVPLKIERGNRVFPQSDKSSDIIRTLVKTAENLKINILLNEKVIDLVLENRLLKKIVTNKAVYYPDKVIMATGGVSYPLTGSTGDGYKFAMNFGHSIIPLKPALVGINIKNTPKLQGLTLKNVNVSVLDTTKNKVVCEEFGELLFTHTGVSGPTILTISSKINRLDIKNLQLIIDLKPALTVEELDARIRKDFTEKANKCFKNSLDNLLPTSLIAYIVELSGILPQKPVNSITKEERTNLVKCLKNMTFSNISLADISEAIVTAGGVSTKEIIPSTMQSKFIDNLYFAGEVVDLDAQTGGFNLQIAFSTAYIAALGATK